MDEECALKKYEHDTIQCHSMISGLCKWCSRKVCYYHSHTHCKDDIDIWYNVCHECIANASETAINDLNRNASIHIPLGTVARYKHVYCLRTKGAK